MDILKLGLIFGGIALLSKKQSSSIGKVYDSRVKGSVPCKNGRYSDSFPTPGACSKNGGVDMEGKYHEWLKNRVTRPSKVKIKGRTIHAKFDDVVYHDVKRLHQFFSRHKEIETIKSIKKNANDSYKSPLDVRVKFRSNDDLKNHFLRHLKNNY